MVTTNHIDQLAEWWETAEVPTRDTLPKDGDRIIIRYNPEWYEIATAEGYADGGDLSDNTRILARAPEPKPAWHDAFAVRARWEDPLGSESEPFDGVDTFVNCGEGWWISGYDNPRRAEELHDVTPLIPAEVTDEMVDRLESGFNKAAMASLPPGLARRMLTVALGLEGGDL